MRFRNSFRLLMENFKHVYNLLWSKLIISLVATALCCTFVLPELLSIINSAQVQTLIEDVKELVKLFLAANSEALEGIKDKIFGKGGDLSQVTSLLSSMALELSLTVVGCALVYLLKRYAETVCHFTTGSMLNDKMATYAESKYWATFVANLGKASVYSLVYVPLIFLFDVAMLAIVWGVFSIVPFIAALFIGMTAVALLQALKLTVTSPWLPAMTSDDKKISEAMRFGDKKERKQRFKMFSGYLVSVYSIIIVNVIAAICTFGSALLITVPASYFFLICMQYVNYYTMKGKKYFLTYDNIESNPDRGDSEHFFEYIEEVEKTKIEQDVKE